MAAALVKHEGFDLERCLAEVEAAGEMDAHVPHGMEDEILASLSTGEQLHHVAAAAKPWPVEKACSRQFAAKRQSGTRSKKDVIWIVLHSQESATAVAAASWFANPASQGSAHLCVDANLCYRTLPNTLVPWGAPGANFHGFHIEQAGFARWSRKEWLAHQNEIKRVAYKVAVHAKFYGIPLRLLTPAQMRSGYKGITTHARCTVAFGGTHTDPGTGYPLDRLLAKAKAFRAQL